MGVGEAVANHRPSRMAGISSQPFRETHHRSRGAPKPRTVQERWRGQKGLSLWARGATGQLALTIADSLLCPLLRQHTYTRPRRNSHRPARTDPLAAAAHHWRRVGGGGSTPTRPGSGRGAALRQPSPGLIGLDHTARDDWLSQRQAEPVGVVEDRRPIISSGGRGEKGGERRERGGCWLRAR